MTDKNSFEFRRDYDRSLVLGKAVAIRASCRELTSMPILPGVAEELEAELVCRSVHATAAVAGNPMGRAEVRERFYREPGIQDPPSGPTVARARREIDNLVLAYKPLPKGRSEEGTFGVSEGFVRKVHAVMAQGVLDRRLGEYAGNPETGRTAEQVRSHMLELSTWINTPDLTDEEPAIRAGLLHYHLLRLRPFNVATGRVARFFEASVLAVAGLRYVCLTPPLHYLDRVDRYQALASGPSGARSLTDFLLFVLEGLDQGLGEVRGRLLMPMRTIALRVYFEDLLRHKAVGRRMHELLHLLLDHPAPFLLKDLFLRHPFKLLYDRVSEHTARRDLNRLMELGLLTKSGASYEFNRTALG